MNKDFEDQLIRELETEGITPDEKDELFDVINMVKKTSGINRSENFKKAYLNKLSNQKKEKFFYSQIYIPALLFTFLLFILIAGTVSAQKSLPGQPLYPVKILSENIIKTVNPSFNNEILKRRSEEIKSLSEQKKDSGLLQKTLDNYSKELETKSTNSVKIEESKKNLEEAKEASVEKNKKKIEEAIEKTENKILEIHDEDQNRGESIKIEVKSAQTSHEEENNKIEKKGGHEGESEQKEKD
ncbi:MAG: hypothetical protein HYT08_04860 [Candidatus Levybacteria bacterium]|nr:hypothetical protein [Candidatus Levybacteria bacterium]